MIMLEFKNNRIFKTISYENGLDLINPELSKEVPNPIKDLEKWRTNVFSVFENESITTRTNISGFFLWDELDEEFYLAESRGEEWVDNLDNCELWDIKQDARGSREKDDFFKNEDNFEKVTYDIEGHDEEYYEYYDGSNFKEIFLTGDRALYYEEDLYFNKHTLSHLWDNRGQRPFFHIELYKLLTRENKLDGYIFHPVSYMQGDLNERFTFVNKEYVDFLMKI